MSQAWQMQYLMTAWDRLGLDGSGLLAVGLAICLLVVTVAGDG